MKHLTLAALLVVQALWAIAQPQRRIALVIGNSAYQHATPLKNSINDALLMETTLNQLGFAVMKTTNASKMEMQRAIDDFKLLLDSAQVALFYYAGHGMEIGGKNLLIPVDARNADANAVRIGSIDLQHLVEEFENHPQNTNIVILDACRDNPFLAQARGGGRGFKALQAPSGTVIAYATAPGATASDGEGDNGLYTKILAQEMLKPQRLEDVFINTRNLVNAQNKGQNPQEWSQLRGKFYFVASSENEVAPTNWLKPKLVAGEQNEAKGDLVFNSELAGSLFLNDVYVGTIQANSSANRLPARTAGTYTLRLEGPENYTATIDIAANTTTYHNIRRKTATLGDNSAEFFTDPRDGRIYRTIVVGKKRWMAQNLAYTYEGLVVWSPPGIQNREYGYLYPLKAAKKVCPVGWHLATDEEWKELEAAAGMLPEELNETGNRGQAAEVLKSTAGWNFKSNGLDKMGFGAQPAGFVNDQEVYDALGSFGIWWTASSASRGATWGRRMAFDKEGVSRSTYKNEFAFSVRCVAN